MARFQKRGLRAFVAGISIVLGSAICAPAAVINYSTDFNAPTYTDGGLVGQDGWLQTGTIATTPLMVSNTATNGIVSMTTGQDANHLFTPAATSDSVFVAADITLTTASSAGDYFLHMGDGGASNFYDRLYAKAATGGFVMALGTSSGTATYGTTVLSFGTTYHIVEEYDFVAGLANDTGALFVNPSDPLGIGDTPYVAATTVGIDATSISSVNLRQGGSTTAPTMTIDNITVTSAPEPASLGLLAVAGLALVRRKR